MSKWVLAAALALALPAAAENVCYESIACTRLGAKAVCGTHEGVWHFYTICQPPAGNPHMVCCHGGSGMTPAEYLSFFGANETSLRAQIDAYYARMAALPAGDPERTSLAALVDQSEGELRLIKRAKELAGE